MEFVSIKSLRCAALALMLGISTHAQSAQIFSLDLSLSATDFNLLVNRVSVPHPFSDRVFTIQSRPGDLASAPSDFRGGYHDDAAFLSAASTNGWLRGGAAPLLILAGLLVLGLVRIQRGMRMQGIVSL